MSRNYITALQYVKAGSSEKFRRKREGERKSEKCGSICVFLYVFSLLPERKESISQVFAYILSAITVQWTF